MAAEVNTSTHAQSAFILVCPLFGKQDDGGERPSRCGIIA